MPPVADESPRARSERLRRRASDEIVLGRSVHAVRSAEEALAAAELARDRHLAGWACVVLGAARSNLGDRVGSLAAIDRGEAAFLEVEDAGGLGAVLALRALGLLEAGAVAAAIDAYARAFAALERSSEAHVEIVNALVELAIAASEFGDLRGARELAARAVDLGARVDDPFATTYAAGALPTLLVARGIWHEEIDPAYGAALLAEAAPLAASAVDLADEAGDRQQAATSRADLALALADRDGALADVERLAAAVPVDDAGAAAPRALALARARAHAGRDADALAALDALVVHGADEERRPFAAAALRLRSQLLERQGDAAGALAAARAAAAVVARREAAATHALETITEARLRAARAEVDAREDALTGLGNRRRLDEALAALPTPAASLALVDVDRFKRINDRFGHAVGDEVLRRVSAALRERCRPGDVLARYAGDELVALFPETELAVAGAICEGVRAAIAAGGWHDLAPELAVTVSIGVAATRTGDAAGLLAAADANLYLAKGRGRDAVASDVAAA